MHCLTLDELPGASFAQAGWPWTEESTRLPDKTLDGQPWPRVTIVTPSFNQAAYIEETIRSVLLQGYPNLEYIVIDGGSTDGSVEIIRRYAPWLSYWVSESDNGQSDALNKGFARATGEIIGWLNSDDHYRPDALQRVGQELDRTAGRFVVYGDCEMTDAVGHNLTLIKPPAVSLDSLIRYWVYGSIPPQPAIFFRKELLDEVGLLDMSLDYAMDYDLWLRMARRCTFHYLPLTLASYRVHPQSKTGRGWSPFVNEWNRVSRPYWGRRFSLRYGSFWLSLAANKVSARTHLRFGFRQRWIPYLRRLYRAGRARGVGLMGRSAAPQGRTNGEKE